MLEHVWSPPRAPARVVVMGSRGFLGRAVVAELSRHDIAVRPVPASELDLVAAGADAALAALLEPDDALVFNSTLTPDRGRGIDTFMANLKMAENACAALAAAPVAHLVYLSSDAVYPPEANPVVETGPAAPADLYAAMHVAREQMFRAAHSGPLAVLRPTLMYGAADPHNGYGPNRFRRQAAAGEPIRLFGEGEETRDHIAVEDVAALIRRILTQRSSGILNVASGQSVSFRAVAEQVAALFDPPATVAGSPRQNPISHRHFDITALLKAFPDFRFTPLADGLARAHADAAAAAG